MDHLVHLETSLLILPACACGTHADRCIHENTGFIALSLAENVQKEEGHMAYFRDIGEEGPTGTFLQLIILQWVGNIERRKGPCGPFLTLTVVHTF